MSDRSAVHAIPSDAVEHATVELPEVPPRSTRQQWTRSAVASIEGATGTANLQADFVVGTGRGVVRALDADGAEQWAREVVGMVVALEPSLAGGEPVVLVGTRGETAVLALLDATDGDVLWSHDLAADIGSATKETLFYYPMTVDLASDPRAPETDGERLYAAARRYERNGDARRFESRVYAIEPDGETAWTYDADSSPISLARRDGRLAVAFNRCHGDHQSGLVVLDADTGAIDWTWDPGTDGPRRVGDVALDADGVVVASHGDYCGYALTESGDRRWRVDLGRPVERGDETVYTYPNHVAVDDGQVLFLTGNTFPAEGRETDARHPREHALAVVDRERGTRARSLRVEGWVGGQASADGARAIAVGQHFRDRDPDVHGLRLIDSLSGDGRRVATDGIATAVAVADGRVGVLEEPIAYHDEDATRGTHRLHVLSV